MSIEIRNRRKIGEKEKNMVKYISGYEDLTAVTKQEKTSMKSFLKCKSCEKMDELADNSVHLIITSPPYWNAIDYDQHTQDRTKNFRTRKGDPYDNYLGWLEICFKECYRVLKPGRFCCVVIGTVLHTGKHYPLPQHFVARMERIGFEFHQDIIWYKVTGGVKRAGVTIQHPYPGYYCPNIMTEYILIFRKPGVKMYTEKDQSVKEKNKIEIDTIFTKELANNIWHIAPVPPNQYHHPCPFPEEIPYRLIGFFSYEGETVLDPFIGIGTTAKVAAWLNRGYAGYDIKEQYITIAEKRIEEPLKLREQLISRFEKVPINMSLQYEEKTREKESQLALFKELAVREKKVFYNVNLNEGVNDILLDYKQSSTKYPWLSGKKQKMVLSTDFDGILSGAFLNHLLKWDLVGFYDSKTLWLSKEFSIADYDKLVYIDMDINRRNVKSIGHHVLKWRDDTPIPEHEGAGNNTFNPNLERGITLKNKWKNKYPFATIHLLLVFYQEIGIQTIEKKSEHYLPLLLHADSTIKNIMNYPQNIVDWISFLGGSEDEASPLYPICKVLTMTSFRRLFLNMHELYQKMEDVGYNWGSQAVMGNPTDRDEWHKLLRLLDFINETTGWEAAFPNIYSKLRSYEGSRTSTKPNKGEFTKMIETKNPFSYAIISQGEGGLNYTVFKDI